MLFLDSKNLEILDFKTLEYRTDWVVVVIPRNSIGTSNGCARLCLEL